MGKGWEKVDLGLSWMGGEVVDVLTPGNRLTLISECHNMGPAPQLGPFYDTSLPYQRVVQGTTTVL